MTQAEAETAAEAFRNARWDVTAHPSPLKPLKLLGKWELRGKAADGGGDVYAFDVPHMKALTMQGKVKSLP